MNMRAAVVVLLIAPPARAQWPSDPAVNLAVCDSIGDQAVPKIASGGDGTTWIAWFDNRGGSYAVYAQKLDAQGNEVFAHDGLLVSAHPQSSSLVDWSIASDGAGGCVLAFTDIRAGPDLDVYACRIDGAGSFLWGPDGATLSANADYEANPHVARLSDGSFAVTWSRLPSPGPGAVHVQKLSAAGTPQFAGDGLQIAGPGVEKPGFSQVAASDAGGWIVGYVRDITTFSSPRHLRAQKFDAAGNALWNGGTPIAVYDAASMPIAHQPAVQSDGAGGGVFSWHSSVGAFFDCWIQRVTAAGAEVHAHNGLQVSTEASRSKLDPSLAVLTGGDVVVAFNKRNSAQSTWATCVQRIDPTGARLWTDDGIELLPYDGIPKQFERCVPYGDGAVVLACEQTNYPAQGLRVLAFRVDAAGLNRWSPSGVVVSSVLSPKDKIPVTVDASGVVRAAWDDARNDSGDIYAQNVNGDGTLGVGSPMISFCDPGAGGVAACPCGNPPSAAGRGCDNSSATGGASLAAAGTASIAADTVVFTTSGEKPTATSIVLQGDASIPAGAVFGQGIRCAGGTLKRLYVKTAVGGSISAPQGGDPSVSARSAALGDPLAGGSTRYYGVYYRDPTVLGGCPATSTYNVTQSGSIGWVP